MPEPARPVDRAVELTNRILAHYDAHARDLPWRSLPGRPRSDPYHVWLSEIMLQQTSVAAVKPYFEKFLAIWPSVEALAAAKDEDVMQQWAGLGYYARARNLLKCARVVADDFDGHFPEDESTLRTLPGIGPYSAAAIAAIAFGKRAVVVDANVERVIARIYAVDAPLPGCKPQIYALCDALTPAERAGDFAQAMMDLGATICTARSADCAACPAGGICASQSDPLAYPVKAPKRPKPIRKGTALWIEQDGKVLLVTRPEKGLLGGMLALPSHGWDGTEMLDLVSAKPLGQVTHIFTHFQLDLDVVSCLKPKSVEGAWWPADALETVGLPTLFKKAANVAKRQKTLGD